ncbi:acyl-CoA thioesterase [Hymenobacter taeanensis]|uniref:Acyl-CoA thioesterase n=1 Tax=Hymenobacter taeanensis TaxID=2735321 RepID=A0A6M6BI54_9BACT|nr:MULTISPECIES: thioesterase family protein [Hymenobacter]QJX47662.1 acyl-CoA thioesterase [Hymenobacter taeanensis]UOQ82855.1 acyl-CoA thioesterase [Hymenobacter sp. 5414T-23]
MYSQDTRIRVRYAETDQMGYVYHGNYAAYFEVARTEAFRQLGIRYKDLEADGVGMPVGEIRTRFRRPARYDDLLTVRLMLKQPADGARVLFEYEIYNEGQELLTEGHTLMVFVSMATGRPVPMPASIQEKLAPYFTDDEVAGPLTPPIEKLPENAPAPAAFLKGNESKSE